MPIGDISHKREIFIGSFYISITIFDGLAYKYRIVMQAILPITAINNEN